MMIVSKLIFKLIGNFNLPNSKPKNSKEISLINTVKSQLVHGQKTRKICLYWLQKSIKQIFFTFVKLLKKKNVEKLNKKKNY